MKAKITRIEYVPPSMLKLHERSNLIPEMIADEWLHFAESVRIRGEIIKPLEVLADGRVIDGRHRLKAALECNIELVPIIYKELDESEVVQLMMDSGMRRNLTHGQRAAIVLKCEELVSKLKEEARINSLKNLKKGNDSSEVVPVPPRENEGKKTRDILAEQARVGGKSMQNLIAVQKGAGDLFEQVASGEMPIKTAYKAMKKREIPEPNVIVKENILKPNVVAKLPKSSTPKKTRLSELKAEVEKNSSIKLLENESNLSDNNILRHRADKDFREYTNRLVVDYELLKNANRDSINIYLNGLKKIAEGVTLLLAEYEEKDELKIMYEEIATLIRYDRSEEGQEILIRTIGGNKSE